MMKNQKTKRVSNSPSPPPIATESYYGHWNLEDRGSTPRKVAGALLLLFGVVCFVSATAAPWSFFDGSPSSTSDTSKYYYLLVLVTLPASVIFVYLNWLAVSFFKTA
jgi:hypothetical protein